ncbi:type II secretion system protein GspC [Vibrio sagamiensis]|uniref:Type II secretion system protein GspC n=1 Tax=Vibrio sagamiensis NBRC 104589 TaxID=1219064 RepID=A0A511QEZ7_9VIBR|nr:type II secretion system protein GspC [Vibrio sagamiensis]PNQ71274.1 type II secretion system protein GspC [Vibrio agarivorans]GEM75871.1 type II secretion system protein GspC [Vibrio sagamiensis NBRC 104589]
MKRLELNAGLSSSPILARIKSSHHVIQSKLSSALAGIFIAVAGWSLGGVVWLVVPQGIDFTPWQPKATSLSASRDKDVVDVNALQSANLFGQYSEKKSIVVEQPVVKDAPKTRLNLTLVGAVASSNSKVSLAVIANRGKQATYGIGEQIDGTRAELKAVLVDRVIIENQGRDETLMLEGVDYKKLSETQHQRPSRHGVKSSIPSEKLEQIKAELAKDGSSVFTYINISPVMLEGGLAGYRVSPGRDAALFNSVGLKPGDIAIELNGIDLRDSSSGAQLSRIMQDLQELNLTVERDGQQYDINIQL